MNKSNSMSIRLHKNKYTAGQIIAKIILYLICIVVAIMVILPIISLVISVTRASEDIDAGFKFEIGSRFIDNLTGLINHLHDPDTGGYSIARAFLNSVIISVSSTSLCIYFSAMTAYACHVYDFKGKAFFEKFILFLIIIPGQLGAVGFYTMALKLNWMDTYIPFIFPAIASPSTVFFMRQYLKQNFSREYVDAARMDGANEFITFNRICLPFIKSALATMALFGIISSWNNFMGPVTFLSKPELFTLPQIVSYMTNDAFIETGPYYMGILITALPMLLIYFFLSKVIMKGVSAGGLK